ncbi:MAG: hypothetical protein H7338_09620, partial [Candidatus Sericytochromatia bacterium]|nr:hypothetical protein [Candidatus Sericytochromatia bacterium]
VTLGLATWLMGCGSETPTTQVCLPAANEAAVVPAPKPTGKPTAKPPVKKPTTTASAKPGSTPPAKPAAGASAAPEPEAPDAMDILNEVKTVTLGQTSLRGTISNYEMKFDKSKTSSSTFKMQSQGLSYRLECSAHSKPSNVGSKTVLVYGQPTARVKPAGLLSLVTVTLALTDANLLSQNGITLDKILSHGILERLTNGEYDVEQAGTTTIGSDKITILKATKNSGPNPLFADADYEYVGFDEKKLYRMWALYAKPELALPQNNLLYQVTVTGLETGVTIAAAAFKL